MRRASLICWLSLSTLACGDDGSSEGGDTAAETGSTSQGPTSGTPPTTTGPSSATSDTPTTDGPQTDSDASTTDAPTTDAPTTGDASGSDSGSSGGVQCDEGLRGFQEGCPCEALGGDGFPPFVCSNELVCAMESTCIFDATCDDVPDDGDGNETFETATDLGMLCGLNPFNGHIQAGDTDWYTWTLFDFEPTCQDLWSAGTFDPDIEVCIFEGCENDSGTVTPGDCGPLRTAESLGPNIHGCCGAGDADGPNNTLNCGEGQQSWVRLTSTANACVGYELELY